PGRFLSGLGISFIIRKIKLFSVVISIIFLTAFAGFTASYFGAHARVLGQEFCEGFGEAMAYVEDLDWDRIYVTNWSYNKGNQFISDIFTLFFHNVEPTYYQDKAKAYSKAGRELLPYHERYQFVNFEDFTFNPEEKAVYIVNNNDLLNYDPERFQITRFTSYSAIIPKQLINTNHL
ncbi:MAG TPA: hypothetical protein VHY08_22605, partial [Bacillota bacterium]|nr:hypothetical protein [Bacillota bacterium]